MPKFRITWDFFSFTGSQNTRSWRGSTRIIDSNWPRTRHSQEPHHVPERVAQTLHELCQPWCRDQVSLPSNSPTAQTSTAANRSQPTPFARCSCTPAFHSLARFRSEVAEIRRGTAAPVLPAASLTGSRRRRQRPHSGAEMAAGGGAGGERGSRERRRGAGPGSANGARAGGSLKPLSGGRGSARPGPASLSAASVPPPPRSASPARSHGRHRGLLR